MTARGQADAWQADPVGRIPLPLSILACGCCGPSLGDDALFAVGSILLLKPVAYFAFAHAYRYRVSGSSPMTWRRAACLAGMRTGLGLLLATITIAILLLFALAAPPLAL